MQSETLAQEFALLVKEYHEGDDHTKPEAWNLLADYAVDNADAISAALSDQERAVEVANESLAAYWDNLAEVLLDKDIKIVGLKGVTRAKLADKARETSVALRHSALVDVPVEPVGEAGEMPGSNGGFTMAVFKSSDVPLGTKLYTSPSLSREGEDAKAEQYWSTVEQLANCEDEISRLRAEVIPTDPTDAMIDAALAADWECDGDERAAAINVWHAMRSAALAATRSGSAEGGDHG